MAHEQAVLPRIPGAKFSVIRNWIPHTDRSSREARRRELRFCAHLGSTASYDSDGEVEGVCRQVEGVEVMELKVNLDAPRVDGGMLDHGLLMEIQADILNRNVVRPLKKETTPLGSASAAGRAVRFYKDLEQLRANWGVGHTWKLQMESFICERLYPEWKKAVTRSFDWAS